MMQAPLPSMPEYDPLDEHLADLEEPGANLMQEFVLRGTAAPATFNTTPLSVSNGYTSEESDYSVTTPSDEQMYADMTFMETADTSELVEVVADYVEDNDLTALSPKTQRVFADKQAGAYAAGKMIKGKTSKYRGVTQTSKTSWGAKYSAKRITNTCKTQDEAARAYDLYLKENHPEKYPKFANFCVRCDRFVNPLGLPEFRNECCCDATSDGGSTEVESPPAASETDGDDLATIDSKVFVQGMDIHDNNIPVREGSNLSIGSLKLSFLDDLDVSMLPPQDHQQISVDGNKPIKRDSLTMAAVESFSNEDNLDHIIKDINRSSSSSFSKKPSFTRNNSLGHSVGLNSSSSTTVNDFSPEEWQNLSDYLMSDHGQPGVLPAPVPTMANMQTAEQQRSKLNKLHSLDFDATEPVEHMDIKQEYPSAMDVDDLASAFMPPPMMNNQVATPTPAVPSQTHSSVAFPARVNIQTPFLEKYWRNDRKNIQCFPYCPEHGDYYRVRIENLQHRCKGVCRAAVKAHVTVPTTQLLSPSGLLLLARCNSTFSRNVALSAQQFLNVTEIKNLQSLSSVGVVEQFGVLPDGSGVQFEVTFYPDVWKFEFDLPKKRRHGSAADELDAANSEFLYFFEIDVFYTTEKTLFQRLGHAESMSFQIGNTRTLLRQRNRMNEEPSDADRILGMDAMPEKKKVRMYLGQHGRNSTILSEDSEYVDQAVVQNAKLGDSDALNRIDSKDSTVDLEAGSSSAKPWKHHDDDETDATSYGQYVSPKSAKTLLGGTEASTTATMVKSGAKAAHDAERDNLDATIKGADETHSSSKLFAYSFVSIPLSIVFMPLTLFLLIGFVIVPPTAGSIVRLLDAISDMELRRANSSCIRTDSRIVLDRLDTGKGKGMFRYHSEGAVWSRFVYFCGVKLVITIVMFVPVLLFSLLGVISFPIRPLSKSLFRSANACSLVSREYTRKSVGKPYSNHASTQGDALV